MGSRELFGTDGIRGIAGEYPLTPDGAEQIGRAIGAYFGEGGEEVFCLGGDTRESTEWLGEAVARGVNATGVDIENLGVLPTPALAYITRETGASAGIMITASHNPYGDNGIKVFNRDGGKLPDETESELNRLIGNENLPRSGSGRQYDGSNRIDQYVEHIIGAVDTDLGGLRVALDLANGATSRLVDGTPQSVAEMVFTRLGAVALPLFDHPDGRNINADCGATDTRELQRIVASGSGEMGFAFDGDGDRVFAVDAQGRLLTGDNLLYILALCRGESGVVATHMSNMGLELALNEAGIAFYRKGVGDRYVLEGLEEHSLRLGGEQSGHIIVTDYMPTGDGLLAAGLTAKHVLQSGQSLAEWRDSLSLLPQELVNVKIPTKAVLEAALADPDVQAVIAQHTEQLAGTGRVYVRQSGTEPKARVMVESDDAAQRAEVIADQIRQVAARMMLAHSA